MRHPAPPVILQARCVRVLARHVRHSAGHPLATEIPIEQTKNGGGRTATVAALVRLARASETETLDVDVDEEGMNLVMPGMDCFNLVSRDRRRRRVRARLWLIG